MEIFLNVWKNVFRKEVTTELLLLQSNIAIGAVMWLILYQKYVCICFILVPNEGPRSQLPTFSLYSPLKSVFFLFANSWCSSKGYAERETSHFAYLSKVVILVANCGELVRGM